MNSLVSGFTMRWSGAQKKVMNILHATVLDRLSCCTSENGQQVHQSCGFFLFFILRDPNISKSKMLYNGLSRACAAKTLESSLARFLAFFLPLPINYLQFVQVHWLIFCWVLTSWQLIIFSLYELCLHPEYIEPLRKEIARVSDQKFTDQNEEMPLLDSFVKETARLHPIVMIKFSPLPHRHNLWLIYWVLIVGSIRKVLSPFTFADGVHVPPGNMISIYHQGVMRNAANYANPENFDGFRFAKTHNDGSTKSASRLTNPSSDFSFFGSPRQAWSVRALHFAASKMDLYTIYFRLLFEVPSLAAQLIANLLNPPSLPLVPPDSMYRWLSKWFSRIS